MQITNIKAENKFANKVYEIVESIPSGKVMTYGQIAALAGNAGAARIVGSIAHYGPPETLVGRWALQLQRQLLEAEGIKFGGESKIQDFEQMLHLND